MNILEDLIIFEMANSHQGSIEHGIAIIREMGKIARVNKVHAAVKLQYRDLNTFIHQDARGKKDVPHVLRFEETRLEYDDFCVLIEEIRKEGLVTMSTPFDEKGVIDAASDKLPSSGKSLYLIRLYHKSQRFHPL